MRLDYQNKSVHAVATTLVFDRVENNNLSDNGSQRVLKDTDMNDLVKLYNEELEHLQTRHRVFIPRHLKEHFPSFKNIDKHLPQKTSCSHAEDMSKKIRCHYNAYFIER